MQNINYINSQRINQNGNLNINARENYQQTSGQLLAKNRLDISAEKVTFDTAENTLDSQQKQSDLKLGQFSRVVSPLIDLVQSVESALTDKEASDRIKTAQMLGVVAKGYTAYTEMAAGGAIMRAESGVGFSHSRNQSERQVRESQGNQLNAQQINITARSGDLTAIQTAFTSKDSQGNRLANSQVNLNAAKDILLMAGESQTETKGKQQSVGSEVGMGVSVGAQTGVYVYAQEGFSKGKQSQKETTYQNSRIETETFNLTSGGNTTLSGAKAQAKTINADIKGDLNIISLQDEGQSRSQSIGVGGRVQGSFGTAWGASGYGSGSRGKGAYKQVTEQSGLFAEEGGYHITANNVHLKGGAIASTNGANSELATNKLTFEDIQNSSSVTTMSGGVNGSVSSLDENATAEEVSRAKNNGTPTDTKVIPSLPLADSRNDSTVTKATLTEGKITLNKDTNPTEMTTKALGINTELSQANNQTTEYNLAEIQKTQTDMAKLVASGANIVGTVSQKMGWKDGSPQKMALHGLLGYLAAKESGGNLVAGIASGAGSELLNTYVAEYLQKNPNLSEVERNAIQSVTAMGFGSLLGNMVGGDSQSSTLGMNVGRLAEENNRQLHPTEQARINDLANKLAKETGKEASYWREKLTLVASAMVDEQADKLVSGGISEISRSPFAERANYSQDLKIAYDIMKKEALKNETLKWQDGKEIELYGEKMKMFQSTEKQFKDNKMFGNVNYPSVIQKYNINSNLLDEIGKLNGLGVNANKYSSELLGTIAQGNKQRQDNNQVLNKDYYNYILSPQGRAEAVAPELMLIGGAGNSVSKVLETGVAKGRVLTKEAGSVVGTFANKYPKTAEGIVVGSVSTGFDVSNGEATPEKTMLNYILGGALAGKPVPYQLSTNAIYKGVEASAEKKSDNEIIAGQAASAVGTVSSSGSELLLERLGSRGIKSKIISNVGSGYLEKILEELSKDKKESE